MLESPGLDLHSLSALGQARLPACERLGVALGPLESRAERLQSLFGGEGLPRLRRLKLDVDVEVDALATMLAPSPLVRQLERLALIGGELGDAGGRLDPRPR